MLSAEYAGGERRCESGRWLLIALASSGLLVAQAPPPDDGNGDPGPGRGVARISVINGNVSVRRGDSADVVAAALNAPLVVQDRLLTSGSSRAEVQFDSANILRVGANSDVRFAGLSYKNYQIQVAAGIITFTSLRQGDAQVELDTPSVSLKPLKAGAYRITVHDDGSSEITVRAGEAEIFSPAGSQKLEQGQAMQARGNPADPEFQIIQASQLDSWDRWNADRDQVLSHSQSRQFVSPDINGAEDLDQHGRWLNDQTYGQVWAPTVAPGWAPYQDGRWVWEDFYGWTWVSNDPWGWAPYHYGRWFNGPVGWCWYPGPIYARQYWSPALVGFFGWGGGVGFGFGFGNVGWVPLAPFEPFHRWWGPGFGRGGIVNNTIVNNVNITNIYRNSRVPNGVTGVSTGQFGRNTGRFTPVSANQIQSAGLVRGGLPVAPDRNSLRFADRQVNAASFPQSRNDRFFTHNQPAAVQRTPFEQQQRVMAQTSAGQTPGRAAPSVGGASHDWSRFGEPIHGAESNSASHGANNVAPQPRSQENFNSGRAGSNGPTGGAASSGNSSGWRRFGAPSTGGFTNSSRSPEVAPRGTERQQYEPPQRSGGTSYAPAPRNNFEPSTSGGSTSRGGWNGASAPVRIAPPIVRERAPGYGGGGSSRSVPSYSGGGSSRSAPSYGGGGGSRPAPSSGGSGHSGGGGGGAHSGGGHSGGGGGGGHHGR